jgi:uncharacterized caspase-like protein
MNKLVVALILVFSVSGMHKKTGPINVFDPIAKNSVILKSCHELAFDHKNISDKRIALIMGNSTYKTGTLVQPVNNAELLSEVLTKAGFAVTLLKNGTLKEMNAAMVQFSKLLGTEQTTIGFFYFAGQGLQINSNNYMVPSDAIINQESNIAENCIDLNSYISMMPDSKVRLKIFVFDANRNNPHQNEITSSTQGPAFANIPVNTIYACSTAPGGVVFKTEDKYSLFAGELAKMILIPDLTIDEVLNKVRKEVFKQSGAQQSPWISSTVAGDYYFLEKK